MTASGKKARCPKKVPTVTLLRKKTFALMWMRPVRNKFLVIKMPTVAIDGTVTMPIGLQRRKTCRNEKDAKRIMPNAVICALANRAGCTLYFFNNWYSKIEASPGSYAKKKSNRENKIMDLSKNTSFKLNTFFLSLVFL